MSTDNLKRISVSIPEEQKDFLEQVMHEDAATNLSQAVQWCIDSCMRIEKLYGVDACYVAFHDIRLPENDPARVSTSTLDEALQLACDAGMSQADWDRQNPEPENIQPVDPKEGELAQKRRHILPISSTPFTRKH